MSKILFITEKVSFISEGIVNHLKEESFDVTTIKPDVTAISNNLKAKNAEPADPEDAAIFSQPGDKSKSGSAQQDDDTPQIFILYLQNEENTMPDVLGYLRDLVEDKGIRLFVIGTHDEINTVMSGFPPHFIAKTYVRPVDFGELIKSLQKESEAIDKQKEFKTVLIVDDDPTALRSMKSLLSSKYKIFVANSGVNAITILAKNHVDLILLDFEMPVVNGPKVLEMLRSDPNSKDIPVMFLTSKGDKNSILEVVRLKPEKYLLKTMLPKEIMDNIDEFFETRRDRGHNSAGL